MEHWVKSEWRKLFVAPVKSVASKPFPSAVVNLPLTKNLIFKPIYVSCSAGIKNSRSLWYTDAIGINRDTIVSWTDVYTGFCAKMSNSEPTMLPLPCLRLERSHLGKAVNFYNLSLIFTCRGLILCPFIGRSPLTFESLPAQLI